MDRNDNHQNDIESHSSTSSTPATLSSHLYDEFALFTNASVSIETKLETIDALEPFLGENHDAYISLSGDSHQAHLPALTNWNGSSGLRKAYTLLMWIRPRIIHNNDDIDNDPSFSEDKEGEINEQKGDEFGDEKQRILYRISTSTDDASGTGVCVVCSQWKAVPVDEKENRNTSIVMDEDDDDQRKDNKSKPQNLQLETMLTAYSLPHFKSNQLMKKSGPVSRSTFVQQPLILEENKWQLLGFSHTHPYLKPAVWSVTVNGRLVGSDQLPYPVLPEQHHVNSMEYCSVLQNITYAGAVLLVTAKDSTATADAELDYKKTASQLQEQANQEQQEQEKQQPLSNKSMSSKYHQEVDMIMDVAAIALYAEKPVPNACLAVAADAGPALALQKAGRILPTLPPVPNWTKGASLEGPKVGIPLAVHSSALNLQQLASAPQLIFCCSAVSARVLGSPNTKSTRLVCSMQLQPGSTSNTPRVGLIQPATPVRCSEDELPCLYVVGHVRLYHSISQYLLNMTDYDVGEQVSSTLDSMTKNFSVALAEQQVTSTVLQPFFLSLCPPGKVYDRHQTLYIESLKHLYALYSNNAVLAAKLINLFTLEIRSGGGRVHEEVLQSGLIHVLASSLRLSLFRANRLKLFQETTTEAEFLRRVQKIDETSIAPPQHGVSVGPSFIPPAITKACVELLDACCGPPQTFLEDLSPHHQIRRTSDIALTALFGLALDLDLWGGNPKAAADIFRCVAERYGGICVTSGYVLRSQVSVQHFLDMVRLRFDDGATSAAYGCSPDLERAAVYLSKLLQTMLLSSLSNTRSIAQGENDIASCIGALCDCPLGTVGAHVILNALVGVMVWCEVLPAEAVSTLYHMSPSDSVHEQDKMQIASRLGRNILMAEFHDVIAPMILSRTVFSGERTILASKSSAMNEEDKVQCDLCWEKHWQLSLLLFSWVASVAGPEGVLASKSCGKLLLASSLAGSLKGALENTGKAFISTLFLPSPTMALLIGSSLRNEWSYTDLLCDRLEVMVPLLPGMIVSLMSHLPKDLEGCEVETKRNTSRSLTVLSEILTSVGGAFHRVFGGHIHHSPSPNSSGKPKNDSKKSGAVSSAIKAAKTYAPYLLKLTMLLENQIATRLSVKETTETVIIFEPTNSDDLSDTKDKENNIETWIDVASSSQGLLNEIAIVLPTEECVNNEMLIAVLQSCQKSVLNIAAGLVSNAMDIGGSGAAIPIWQNILTSLEEPSVDHTLALHTSVKNSGVEGDLSGRDADPSVTTEETNPKKEEGNSKQEDSKADVEQKTREKNVLCRLTSLVLFKILKRTFPRDPWGYELSAAVARLCTLIEEKEVLVGDNRTQEEMLQKSLSREQIVLICLLLDMLSYGRNSTGWCQFHLPPMTSPSPNSARTLAKRDATAASKLLLPVLRPSLRIVLSNLERISSSTKVSVPNSDEESKEQMLLGLMLAELNQTLTAAIVGLAFASARDTSLNAMASIRQAIAKHESNKDDTAVELCRSLLVKVAEELRVRYESERRLRETALFDAYEDDDANAKKEAVAGSQTVERLILGNDSFGTKSKESEDITLSEKGRENSRTESNVSDDFVLFHEPGTSDTSQQKEDASKLGFEFLHGLGAALEEWKISSDGGLDPDRFVALLKVIDPFLDAWDAAVARDASDTELVKMFDEKVDTVAKSVGSNAQLNSGNGSDSAAESMSIFFEFAAAEKMRLKEISTRFLPSHRYSRISYVDRFCWAKFMENNTSLDDWIERGTADGNRDVRSRIPSVPCFPQFRRFLPKYLDHEPEQSQLSHTKENEEESSSDDEKIVRRSTAAPAELGAFTKSLLETGHLEIVDITKKQMEEEEEDDDDPALNLPPHNMESMEDDEQDMFSESQIRSDLGHGKDPLGEANKKKDDKNDEGISDDTNLDETQSQDDDLAAFPAELVGKGHHNITTSSFSTPPDNASSSLSLLHSAAAGMIEQHVENCVHVRAEGNRQCTMLLTASHLILEYDGNPEGLYEGEILAYQEEADRQRMADDVGASKEKDAEEISQQKIDRRQRELAALRPKSIRWNLTEVSHIYLRRYRLRDTSLELFFIPTGSTSFGGYGIFSPSSSLFLDFGPGYEGIARRDEAAFAIMRRSPHQAIKQWPDRSEQFLHEQLNRLTIGWVEGRITNFDYLLHLNMLSGRSYNDICQYPVFPWVLSNYTSEELPDLTDRSNYRDLSKPVGALNEDRLQDFLDRFNTFADPSIPPFMYGSHYSTSAGVVLHFLVRQHPFAGLHRQLQGGHFDVADRLFSSIPRTWNMCTGSSAAEVKELTPEWYCNPSFLRNANKFKLGTSQDGEVIDDVILPPWAQGSPEKFVEVMRAALESDICSEMLSSWIDLIFGKKQQGPAAIEAHNVFFYLTYYGTVDVASIEDEALRQATELQIAHFGQCPMQLFKRIHVRRLPKGYHNLSLYQILSSYSQRKPENAETSEDITKKTFDRSRLHQVFGEPLFLPFFSAPMSHWVHLNAPPPGPHAPLISVRFAGIDRCLAVDSKGIFHSFRWAWRSEEIPGDKSPKNRSHFDRGCFVAQRELPRFRSVPRLMYTPHDNDAVVAISKTLFAGRSVLLVLSDGDGCGSLGMQLVDPAKGEIRGEVMVPQIHAARITCIATDPIGTAAGHGGVGGELCLVASADGTASLWRFMSSHYLPLRPRIRLRGHRGHKISAVALCSSLHIAATLSSDLCVLHSIGNGTIIRSFSPPNSTLDMQNFGEFTMVTKFADSNALAVSVQGFIVTICETTIKSGQRSERNVITLHLFTVEGIPLGSKPLESWRGIPHKLQCTPDGTAVMVCCGRGVTMHRLSACQPLEFLDEFQTSESDDLGPSSQVPAAWDIDLGPTLNRPVVAAAACSDGALRLHALPGISAWSDRHRKSGVAQSVGSVLAKPAKRLNQAFRESLGFGRQIAGMGRDLKEEVSSDVKERGVGGFLGNIFKKK